MLLPTMNEMMSRTKRLLLLGSLLIVLLLLSLSADTDQSSVGAGGAEGDECVDLSLSGRDGAGSLEGGAGGDGEGGGEGAEGGELGVGVDGVSRLGLASLAGEDHETGLVGLEPLLVQLESLLTVVLPSVVDGDSNRESLLAPDTSSLELVVGESTSGPKLCVVALGGASDGRAEELSGPAES
jgi:hypothetical protein